MDPAAQTPTAAELVYDFSPLIHGYKDGRVERLLGTAVVPPSLHPETGVQSKDVPIAAGVAARLYLPPIPSGGCRKIPLLVYFHGGGFCIESAYSPTYHAYLNSLAAAAPAAVVSVEYRLAPEHPLPAAYDDGWAAVEWVSSHGGDGGGLEPWLNDHADLQRVFLAGDSAGANIAHHVALRAGLSQQPLAIKIQGILLVHPYFWGNEEEAGGDNMEMRQKASGLWRWVCPASSGCDDPRINPEKDPNLGKLGCERVLVAVAEKDHLRDKGFQYKDALEKSGWPGAAEVMEAKGEAHVFHLLNPTSDRAVALLNKVVAFLTQQDEQSYSRFNSINI